MAYTPSNDHPLEKILHPRSIAVVGASTKPFKMDFVKPLLDSGFQGEIYPVNTNNYPRVHGLKAYTKLSEIQGPVDYVISCIPAEGILDLINECGEKGVNCAHLFTARFTETKDEMRATLEQQLAKAAKDNDVRLIGPNCMGVYNPGMGISFGMGMPTESGKVGGAYQSGGATGEITRLAAKRGVRFSKAISYGNAIDFNECDYLEYFMKDDNTEIIAMYIEGLRNPEKFKYLLREATAIKPVVVLKGGRNEAGFRATYSHTASMSGSHKLWEEMIYQAGAVSVLDFKEMADVLVAFYFLKEPIYEPNVVVLGGSGGPSVNAADICEEAGLIVPSLPEEMRSELLYRGNPLWKWISNPADFSIAMGNPAELMEALRIMANQKIFDLAIAFMPGPWRRGDQPFDIDAHMQRFNPGNYTKKPLAMIHDDRPRSIGEINMEEVEINNQIQQKLIELELPIYYDMEAAANALIKFITYHQRLKSRTGS